MKNSYIFSYKTYLYLPLFLYLIVHTLTLLVCKNIRYLQTTTMKDIDSVWWCFIFLLRGPHFVAQVGLELVISCFCLPKTMAASISHYAHLNVDFTCKNNFIDFFFENFYLLLYMGPSTEAQWTYQGHVLFLSLFFFLYY